jgi:hypothetical protein
MLVPPLPQRCVADRARRRAPREAGSAPGCSTAPCSTSADLIARAYGWTRIIPGSLHEPRSVTALTTVGASGGLGDRGGGCLWFWAVGEPAEEAERAIARGC